MVFGNANTIHNGTDVSAALNIANNSRSLPRETAFGLGIFNHTTNMTFDNPLELMAQVHGLQSMPSTKLTAEQPWYRPYPATVSLILFLHLVFFVHWNTRKTRKQILVSYKQLVHEKKFFKAVTAFIAHPPVESTNGTTGTNNINASENNSYVSLTIDFGAPLDRNQPSRFQALSNGHLSGLPLLMYNSHLLWTCRALEPLFPSSWNYVRALIALTFIGLMLELRLAHLLLQSANSVDGGVESRFTSIQPDFGNNPLIRTRRVVLHRGMGTSTILTSALIFVYRVTFPYIQLQVLPVVSIPCYPFLSYLFCLAILLILSWKFHPLTSVFAGSASALFWVVGITSFLSKPYWGWCLISWVVGLCLLSLKNYYFIPCIDYVAWDRQGVIREEGVEPVASILGNDPRMLDELEEEENSIVDLESQTNGLRQRDGSIAAEENQGSPLSRGNWSALTRRHPSPLRH